MAGSQADSQDESQWQKAGLFLELSHHVWMVYRAMGRGFDVNSALGMPLLRQAGYQAGRQVDREGVSGLAVQDWQLAEQSQYYWSFGLQDCQTV